MRCARDNFGAFVMASWLMAACAGAPDDSPAGGTGADAPAAEGEAGNTPADPAVPSARTNTAAPPAPGPDRALATEEPASDGGNWTAGIVDRPRAVQGVALLQDVRSARHPGWDRIVFEFGDGRLPGYHVEYVDRPVRQCGSGNTVEVAGDGWLSVRMEPADAHTQEGRPTVADRNRMTGLPNLKQLVLTCDFEAQVVWVAGVGAPNPYRITELRDPARLVVDAAHDRR